MPSWELPPLESTSGKPKSIDRNPFRNPEFLKTYSPPPPSRATNPFAIAPLTQPAQVATPEPPTSNAEERPAASTSFNWPEKDNAQNPCARGLPQANELPFINMEQVVGNVFNGINHGNVMQTFEEFHVLRNLPIHPDVSVHLSDYFSGSRDDDVAHILPWIDSTKPAELVLCILGKAGVGKTTLTRHVAMRLRENVRLAAELFLGFALPDWTPELVIRMIAGQLCATFPKLKRAISQAIDIDIGPSVSLETRIRTLILEPIRSLRLGHPLVVFMDALDQWAPHSIFIKALGCLATETHLIRVITSGRPGLEEAFQDVSFRRYDLPDVSRNVMADYFRAQFIQVRWEYGLKPSPQTIDRLVDKADGLFIWSSTLCSLLQDQLSCPKPHDTLIATLRSQQMVGDSDILAKLYHDAINLRFPKPRHREKLKVYLGAVLVLQEPLPLAAFAALVSMEVSVVQKIQADLSTLQTRSTRDTHGVVYPASSTFHLSLAEYLQSTDLPPHLAFPIDMFSSHAQLGKACLEELQRTPSSANPPFMSSLQKYALKYWPTHIVNGTPHVSPASDVDWKATPHCAILDNLSISQWQYWASNYLNSVHTLMLDDNVAASSTSTGETLRSIVSRVVKSLCTAPVAAGAPNFAIAVAEVAIRLQHRSPEAWLDLGTVYRDAAEINDSGRLLERAVDGCRHAVDLGEVQGYEGLSMLAQCLWMRYLRLGSQDDLDEAISLERAVLVCTPPGHSDRASSLNNLASSLQTHQKLTGQIESLDEAIVLLQEALLLWPKDHPDRAVFLANLATSLQTHYALTGKVESLDEAIVLHHEALSLRQQGHVDRASSLTNLAVCLLSHHELTGKVESLDEAIILHHEALSLTPQGHPDRAVSLDNLAASLRSHHELTGNVKSLDEAISLLQEALSLTPQGHPDRVLSLNNLAFFLQSRHAATGKVEGLDEAIVLYQEAVSLCSPVHLHRAQILKNLERCLQDYRTSTGNPHDLDESASSLPPVL